MLYKILANWIQQEIKRRYLRIYLPEEFKDGSKLENKLVYYSTL